MTAPTDDAVLRAALKFMRHDGLCAIIGGYGYCSCGMDLAKTAALAAIPPEQDGYAEGRAREVLAAEYDLIGDGFNANRIRGGHYVCEEVDVALRAIAKTLTPTDRHAEGRIAGLEEAAKIAEGKKYGAIAHDAETEAVDSVCDEITTAIRTIANGGTAAFALSDGEARG